MVSKRARFEFLESSGPLDANSSNKLPWTGPLFWVKSGPGEKRSGATEEGEAELLFLSTRSMSVRNSNSSKIFLSSSSFGSSRTRAFMSSLMGTSILIVARNLEKIIISRLFSTFVFNAPFSLSVCSRRFSILPNSLISFCAVFSPTPGHPGILSEASPINPSMSITCWVDWMSNLAFTCSIPITSNPPVCLGRYMNTFSDTNWP